MEGQLFKQIKTRFLLNLIPILADPTDKQKYAFSSDSDINCGRIRRWERGKPWGVNRKVVKHFMLPNLCIIPDAGHKNVPQPFKKKPWYSRHLFVLFYVKKVHKKLGK